jgi:hypothetical protein
MNDLETIMEAYYKVGITYVVRVRGDSVYLFLCRKELQVEYTLEDLDLLLRRRPFMEFQNGKLASY